MVEPEKSKKVKDKFEVGELATATKRVVVDTSDNNRAYTTEEALVKVLNNQEKLMKLLD